MCAMQCNACAHFLETLQPQQGQDLFLYPTWKWWRPSPHQDFLEVSTNYSKWSFVSVIAVSVFHLVWSLRPLGNVPSSTISGRKVLSSCTASSRSKKCSRKPIFSVLFNDCPSITWAITRILWDKLKQVPQQAASLHPGGEKENSWVSGLFLLLIGTPALPFNPVLPSLLLLFYSI